MTISVSNTSSRQFVIINGVEFRTINPDATSTHQHIDFYQAGIGARAGVTLANGFYRLTLTGDLSQNAIINLWNNDPDVGGIITASIREVMAGEQTLADWQGGDFTPRTTAIDTTTSLNDTTASGYLSTEGASDTVIYGASSDANATVTGSSTTRLTTYQGIYGSLTLDHDGDWVYTLDTSTADYLALNGSDGSDSFTITISDSNNNTTTHTLTIAVEAPPILTVENSTESEAVHPNDTTAQGHLSVTGATGDLTFQTDSQGSYGNLTIDHNGAWQYTLDTSSADFRALTANTTEAFTITVSDSATPVATVETITITISPLGVENTSARQFALINGVEFRAISPDATLRDAIHIASSANGPNIALRPDAYELAFNPTDFSQNAAVTAWNNDADVAEIITASIRTSLSTSTPGAWTATDFTEATTALDTGVSIVDTIAQGYLRVTGASGVVNFGASSDANVTVSGSGTVRLATYQGNYGTLTLDHDGDWVYTLGRNNADYRALLDTTSEEFFITVSDANSSTTHNLSITITPAPVLTVENTASAEDSTAADTTVTIGDTTAQGHLRVQGAIGTVTYAANSHAGHYGTLTLDQNGDWAYTLDRDDPDLASLTHGREEVFAITITDSASGVETTHTLTLSLVDSAPMLSAHSLPTVTIHGIRFTLLDTTIAEPADWAVDINAANTTDFRIDAANNRFVFDIFSTDFYTVPQQMVVDTVNNDANLNSQIRAEIVQSVEGDLYSPALRMQLGETAFEVERNFTAGTDSHTITDTPTTIPTPMVVIHGIRFTLLDSTITNPADWSVDINVANGSHFRIDAPNNRFVFDIFSTDFHPVPQQLVVDRVNDNPHLNSQIRAEIVQSVEGDLYQPAIRMHLGETDFEVERHFDGGTNLSRSIAAGAKTVSEDFTIIDPDPGEGEGAARGPVFSVEGTGGTSIGDTSVSGGVVSKNGTHYGTITLNSVTGAWEFTADTVGLGGLHANQSETLHFNAVATDHNGHQYADSFAITLDGINNAPQITPIADVIFNRSANGAVTRDFNHSDLDLGQGEAGGVGVTAAARGYSISNVTDIGYSGSDITFNIRDDDGTDTLLASAVFNPATGVTSFTPHQATLDALSGTESRAVDLRVTARDTDGLLSAESVFALVLRSPSAPLVTATGVGQIEEHSTGRVDTGIRLTTNYAFATAADFIIDDARFAVIEENGIFKLVAVDGSQFDFEATGSAVWLQIGVNDNGMMTPANDRAVVRIAVNDNADDPSTVVITPPTITFSGIEITLLDTNGNLPGAQLDDVDSWELVGFRGDFSVSFFDNSPTGPHVNINYPDSFTQQEFVEAVNERADGRLMARIIQPTTNPTDDITSAEVQHRQFGNAFFNLVGRFTSDGSYTIADGRDATPTLAVQGDINTYDLQAQDIEGGTNAPAYAFGGISGTSISDGTVSKNGVDYGTITLNSTTGAWEFTADRASLTSLGGTGVATAEINNLIVTADVVNHRPIVRIVFEASTEVDADTATASIDAGILTVLYNAPLPLGAARTAINALTAEHGVTAVLAEGERDSNTVSAVLPSAELTPVGEALVLDLRATATNPEGEQAHNDFAITLIGVDDPGIITAVEDISVTRPAMGDFETITLDLSNSDADFGEGLALEEMPRYFLHNTPHIFDETYTVNANTISFSIARSDVLAGQVLATGQLNRTTGVITLDPLAVDLGEFGNSYAFDLSVSIGINGPIETFTTTLIFPPRPSLSLSGNSATVAENMASKTDTGITLSTDFADAQSTDFTVYEGANPSTRFAVIEDGGVGDTGIFRLVLLEGNALDFENSGDAGTIALTIEVNDSINNIPSNAQALTIAIGDEDDLGQLAITGGFALTDSGSGTHQLSGDITATDQDRHQSEGATNAASYSIEGGSGTGISDTSITDGIVTKNGTNYGTITLDNTTGAWGFTADEDALTGLAEGAQIALNFNATATPPAPRHTVILHGIEFTLLDTTLTNPDDWAVDLAAGVADTVRVFDLRNSFNFRFVTDGGLTQQHIADTVNSDSTINTLIRADIVEAISGTLTVANFNTQQNFTLTQQQRDAVAEDFAITLTGANDAPSIGASATPINGNEDRVHRFSTGDFRFTDEDGDALHSLTIITLPTAGSLSLDNAAITANQVIMAGDIARLTYTPADRDSDYSDAFTYRVSDGVAESGIGTLEFAIAADTLPRFTVGGAGRLAEQVAISAVDTGVILRVFNFSGVMANDFAVYESDGSLSTRFAVVDDGGDSAFRLVLLAGQTLDFESEQDDDSTTQDRQINLHIDLTDSAGTTHRGDATIALANVNEATVVMAGRPTLTLHGIEFTLLDTSITNAEDWSVALNLHDGTTRIDKIFVDSAFVFSFNAQAAVTQDFIVDAINNNAGVNTSIRAEIVTVLEGVIEGDSAGNFSTAVAYGITDSGVGLHTVSGDFNAIDPDIGEGEGEENAPSYSLQGTAGTSVTDAGVVSKNGTDYGQFILNSGTGVWQFTADEGSLSGLGGDESVTLDLEAVATDQGGNAYSDDFTITLNGINDAPILNAVGDIAFTNGSNTATTINLTHNDPDTGASDSRYALSGADVTITDDSDPTAIALDVTDGADTILASGVFNAITGRIIFTANQAVLDSLTPGQTRSAAVFVTVTDAEGLESAAEAFTLTLRPAPPPTLTTAGTGTIIENTIWQTDTGITLTTDFDGATASDFRVYESDGTVSTRFAVTQSGDTFSLTLLANQNIDFESDDDDATLAGTQINLQITAQHGSIPSNRETALITVANINEAPDFSADDPAANPGFYRTTIHGIEFTVIDPAITNPANWSVAINSVIGTDTLWVDTAHQRFVVDMYAGRGAHITQERLVDLVNSDPDFTARLRAEIIEFASGNLLVPHNFIPLGEIAFMAEAEFAPDFAFSIIDSSADTHTVSGDFTTIDPDIGESEGEADAPAYSLHGISGTSLADGVVRKGGVDYGTITLDQATGIWEFTADEMSLAGLNADEGVTLNLRAVATDTNGNPYSDDFTITLNGINDAPILNAVGDIAFIRPQNGESAQPITINLTHTDPDNGASGAANRYEITGTGVTITDDSDPTAIGFDVIDGMGVTLASAVFNAMTGEVIFTANQEVLESLTVGQMHSAELSVTITDAEGLESVAESFTVSLNPSLPPIVTASGTGEITENTTLETDTGITLTTDYLAASAGDFSVYENDGAISTRFAVVDDGGVFNLVLLADQSIDFESESDDDSTTPDPQINLQVTVSNGVVTSARTAVSITVANANEATIVSAGGDANITDSGVAPHTVSGDFTATDPDIGEGEGEENAPSYSLQGTAGTSVTDAGVVSKGGVDYGNFTLDTATGVWQFTADEGSLSGLGGDESVTLDLEAVATDQGGNAYSDDFTISLTGINDAPILNAVGDIAFTNGSNTATAINLTHNDPDTGGVEGDNRYALSGADVTITDDSDPTAIALDITDGADTIIASGVFNAVAGTIAFTANQAVLDSLTLGQSRSAAVFVTVTDAEGLESAAEAFTLTLRPAPPPVVTVSGTGVLTENTSLETDTGITLTSDFEGASATDFRVYESDGTVSTRFAVTQSGDTFNLTLLANQSIDFESDDDNTTLAGTQINLQITAHHGAIPSPIETALITVTNVNEAPIVATPATTPQPSVTIHGIRFTLTDETITNPADWSVVFNTHAEPTDIRIGVPMGARRYEDGLDEAFYFVFGRNLSLTQQNIVSAINGDNDVSGSIRAEIVQMLDGAVSTRANRELTGEDSFITQRQFITPGEGFGDEDTPLSLSLTHFTAGDPDGDALQSVTIMGVPSLGQLTLNGEAVMPGQVISAGAIGGLQYTPVNRTQDYTDTITYIVSDGALDSPLGTLRLTISADNDPTVLMGDSQVAVNPGQTLNLTLSQRHLDAQDSDTPAEDLTYTLTTAPASGVLERNIGTDTDPNWIAILAANDGATGASGDSPAHSFTQADVDAGRVRFSGADADARLALGLTDGGAGGSITHEIAFITRSEEIITTTTTGASVDYAGLAQELAQHEAERDRLAAERGIDGIITPAEHNAITAIVRLTDALNTPRLVETGIGINAITTGTGDDSIDAGAGDDVIDLSLGGDDEVIYRFAPTGASATGATGASATGVFVAWDGGDRVTGFTPGEDTLIFSSTGDLAHRADELAEFIGGLGTAFAALPSYTLSERGAGTMLSHYDVAGIAIHFPQAVALPNGRLAGSILQVEFDAPIAWGAFERQYLGGDAFNANTLQLAANADGRSALEAILGVGVVADMGRGVIIGGDDAEAITADDGEQVIFGGGGADSITLGDGAEEVVYRLSDNGTGVTSSDGTDTITNFALGSDILRFVDTDGEAPTLAELLGRFDSVALTTDAITFTIASGASVAVNFATPISQSAIPATVTAEQLEMLFGGENHIDIIDSLPTELL